MILVSVGTQLPFDRLIKAMDDIAPQLDEPVIAQIGVSSYKPKNIAFHTAIAPIAYDALVRSARVLVSHAGIGTILGAQKHEKPIIVFPRQARFGEHRNDHQLATCEQLKDHPGIYIAYSDTELLQFASRTTLIPTSSAASAFRRSAFVAKLASLLAEPN
ncbi:glucuronosyltransferase (plasmid) [Rhizobium rosettiformans]|uniref:Glucuronosyltransferase n=1 Tax=Rhizobium rosettiformans TaxID=1368430 RepID=A0ABX7F3M4_9HYPH|nr:glycosyltransferase [Rhizobium rosettiformans]QRF54332.1 glucuronosyltransferase [Rhizobium rosettiformans]